jgi:hypothetical protein
MRNHLKSSEMQSIQMYKISQFSKTHFTTTRKIILKTWPPHVFLKFFKILGKQHKGDQGDFFRFFKQNFKNHLRLSSHVTPYPDPERPLPSIPAQPLHSHVQMYGAAQVCSENLPTQACASSPVALAQGRS